jgi:high-affinity Fe2+/Pb2+ permease|tara:strand:+ start:1304 stop:1426 length:123 start_codon:yes stop_codon:yes gene_type:complete
MKIAMTGIIVSALMGIVFYFVLTNLGMDTASVLSGSSVRL